MDNHYHIDVLEEISQAPTVSQRELAGRVGVSLGLLNSILRHLAERGWVKISNMNGRKLRYLLTPDGATQIAKKSYCSVQKIIQDYRDLQECLSELIMKLYNEGYRDFLLQGQSSFSDLVRSSLANHLAREVTVRWGPIEGSDKTIMLNFQEEPVEHAHLPIVHVLKELRNYQRGLNQ